MRAPALTAALLSLLSLLLLGACSSYNVTYDYDVTASYGRYKTFDYYTSKKGTGGTTSLMDKRVRAAVEKELQAKGFSMETKADPDFLVTYYPIVQERKVRSTVHVGWAGATGPSRRHWHQLHPGAEGTRKAPSSSRSWTSEQPDGLAGRAAGAPHRAGESRGRQRGGGQGRRRHPGQVPAEVGKRPPQRSHAGAFASGLE
ncbi:MAG: DUF4136 domain-containing protein [Holophagaceae bacterium]|nr:DUF4136 domain-containing protein [Holophagaceae bacterium]